MEAPLYIVDADSRRDFVKECFSKSQKLLKHVELPRSHALAMLQYLFKLCDRTMKNNLIWLNGETKNYMESNKHSFLSPQIKFTHKEIFKR